MKTQFAPPVISASSSRLSQPFLKPRFIFLFAPLPWRKRLFLFLTLLFFLLLPNGAVINAQDLRYGDSFSAPLPQVSVPVC